MSLARSGCSARGGHPVAQRREVHEEGHRDEIKGGGDGRVGDDLGVGHPQEVGHDKGPGPHDGGHDLGPARGRRLHAGRHLRPVAHPLHQGDGEGPGHRDVGGGLAGGHAHEGRGDHRGHGRPGAGVAPHHLAQLQEEVVGPQGGQKPPEEDEQEDDVGADHQDGAPQVVGAEGQIHRGDDLVHREDGPAQEIAPEAVGQQDAGHEGQDDPEAGVAGGEDDEQHQKARRHVQGGGKAHVKEQVLQVEAQVAHHQQGGDDQEPPEPTSPPGPRRPQEHQNQGEDQVDHAVLDGAGHRVVHVQQVVQAHGHGPPGPWPNPGAWGTAPEWPRRSCSQLGSCSFCSAAGATPWGRACRST